MRMMPCMAGCAGPRLTKRFWLPPPAPGPSPRNRSRVVLSVIALDVGPDEGLAAFDGVVLPERVADERFVEQQAPQVGMPLEPDAEHVPDLPLEPVGDGPEPGRRRHHRRVLLDLH